MGKKNKRKSKLANSKTATPVKSNTADSTVATKPKPAAKSQGKPSRAKPKPSGRRHLLKLLIGLPVAGAAGAAIHRYDVQNRDLHDLSSIGQGQPVVVQVHDPACQLCRQLMNNTRAALKGNEDVIYRVADVNSREGAAFRREHHADTVSLILFDAKGKTRGSIQGVTAVEELKTRFARL